MAAPKICELDAMAADEYPLYFFDANIWIAYLKQQRGYTIDRDEAKYVKFFEDIIELHTNQHLSPRFLPKIVMPALVLTETINALIRHECERYFKLNPLPNGEKAIFKKHYRPLEEYRKKLRKIVTDIQSVGDYLELWDDNFSKQPILNTFSSNPDFDFNDYYYSLLFKGNKVAIVTHDNDYSLFPDIIVITCNRNLLRAGKLFS